MVRLLVRRRNTRSEACYLLWVYRPGAVGYEAGGHVAQDRGAQEQPQETRQLERLVRVERVRDDVALGEFLGALDQAHRPLPAALHRSQMAYTGHPFAQRAGQDVRRDHRVLDGEIDAHASDGRDDVGGVSKEQ